MFSEIFPASNIIADLQSEDKDELFEEMVEVLVSAQPGISRADALAVLKERENKMTTGIVSGIAVPHAISNTVKGVVGAIGISRAGIDYGSLDNKPVHVVFMLLFSPDETERHLQIMKHFAGLLQYQELCNELLSKRTSEEIYDFICSREKLI